MFGLGRKKKARPVSELAIEVQKHAETLRWFSKYYISIQIPGGAEDLDRINKAIYFFAYSDDLVVELDKIRENHDEQA